MKHVFVFDPKSFPNQQWKMENMLDHIGEFFRTQEKPDFSIQISRYRRDAIVHIQKEVETAKEGDTVRIYAIGGAEILYDCVNSIADLPNTELAMVPYGETSDFFYNFGEEKEALFKNIQSLVQKGTTIPTDIFKWNVNYALNSCHIGINSASAGRLRKYKEAQTGGGFFLFTLISSFISNILNNISAVFDRQISAQHYKITIDDKDFSGNYSMIHIANGPYHAGRRTGLKEAAPDDGMLDVAMIKSADPLATKLSLSRYSRGKKPKNCISMQAKKISVQSDAKMWIQMDNEYILDKGVNIEVVPHAVQMVTLDNVSYQKH
jgi:diacylglycerol kinase family enzyme